MTSCTVEGSTTITLHPGSGVSQVKPFIVTFIILSCFIIFQVLSDLKKISLYVTLLLTFLSFSFVSAVTSHRVMSGKVKVGFIFRKVSVTKCW